MKLRLKDLFKEDWFGPGRPEGPGPHNKHHFNKHPRNANYQHHPLFGKTFPYPNPDGDLEQSDAVIKNSQIDPKTQEEDAEAGLSEFFKYTNSARDNTSLPGHPEMGGGAPSSFGKGLKDFSSYDPGVDDITDEKNEKRLQNADSRLQTKAKSIKYKEAVGPGLRRRIGRDPGDYITKQPWASGMPAQSEYQSDAEQKKEEDDLLKYISMNENNLYFHGTNRVFEPGEYLEPPIKTGNISEKGRKKNLDKVFVTLDKGSAKIYAGRATQALGGKPYVYVVEPMGEVNWINKAPGTTVGSVPTARIVKLVEVSPAAAVHIDPGSDYMRSRNTSKDRGSDADLHFWDNIEQTNKFLMNTEDDIKKSEVRRGKKNKLRLQSLFTKKRTK